MKEKASLLDYEIKSDSLRSLVSSLPDTWTINIINADRSRVELTDQGYQIYISRRNAAEFGLDNILLHELAHAVRGDLLYMNNILKGLENNMKKSGVDISEQRRTLMQHQMLINIAQDIVINETIGIDNIIAQSCPELSSKITTILPNQTWIDHVAQCFGVKPPHWTAGSETIYRFFVSCLEKLTGQNSGQGSTGQSNLMQTLIDFCASKIQQQSYPNNQNQQGNSTASSDSDTSQATNQNSSSSHSQKQSNTSKSKQHQNNQETSENLQTSNQDTQQKSDFQSILENYWNKLINEYNNKCSNQEAAERAASQALIDWHRTITILKGQLDQPIQDISEASATRKYSQASYGRVIRFVPKRDHFIVRALRTATTLAEYMSGKSTMKTTRSWSGIEIIQDRPGYLRVPRGNIIVISDVSGSMQSEWERLLAGISWLRNIGYRVRKFLFADVCREWITDDIEYAKNYPACGGGTSYSCIPETIIPVISKIGRTVIVIFTDGLFADRVHEPPLPAPTIWCLINSDRSVITPLPKGHLLIVDDTKQQN